MADKQMKTFNTGTTRYIITDAEARQDIAELQDQVAPLDVSAQSGDVGKALKAKTVANGKVTAYELGEAAIIDATLSNSGQAADAKKTGDEIAALDSAKVNKPSASPNGTSGQLLRTNGDGTTTWVDVGLPTDAQTADAVSAWLDDHPEATTTVQDGAITKAKLDTNLQNTVDDVTDLKSAFVTEDGINKIKAQNLQIIDAVMSPNLLDETKLTEGKYIGKDGSIYTGSSYNLSDYIPVEAGKTYYASCKYNTSRMSMSFSWFAFFNSDKTVNTTASSSLNSLESPFTIPDGVSYIRVSLSSNSKYSQRMIEENTELASYYYEYGALASATIKDEYLPSDLVTDTELSTALGDYVPVSDVPQLLSGYVASNGVQEVTPKNLQIMDLTYAPNLVDETQITDGTYIQKNGTPDTGNYKVTDYIPVDAGGKYYFTWLLNNTSRVDGSIRFLACYSSSKEIMSSAGSDSAINSFPMTIAEGVSFVRLSFSNKSKYSKYQFEKGETATVYYPYGTIIDTIIDDQYLPDDPIEMSEIPAFQLVDGQNLLNQEDPDFMAGFLYTGGTVDATMTSYRTSGYIAVTPGDHLMGSYVSGGGSGYTAFRTVAAYNSNKTAINASGAYNLDSNVGYYVPSGVSFVRICYAYGSYGDNVQICKTDSNRIKPYVPYAEPHYELKGDYLAPFPSAPEHVYLPEEVYVAVDRTIEFYNEQIVLDYEKYYFQWKCAKGYADKRKFSITGTSAGNVNLTLTLYDNKMNICWVGACTIHVVAASNPTVKIIPIGDSLTRGKAWLPEVMLLSSSNVEWLGTRYSNNLKDSENNTYAQIHHEGRSGWSAGDYLADTSYTEDSNYDGIGTVSGSANPFWDGAKFSLNHYLTTQTGVSTPDAVQIFLGTNDLTVGVDSAIENIVAIVESIRSEYADLPIFVCNTIYRSNQNGYGSVGNDSYAGAGAGANSFQYEQDSRVMDLLVGLRNALRSMNGVYLVPLASCMDREYDFGQTMTKVNPRSAVEIAMPTESVHPQAPGYYQMADVMYSFYCGLLAD